MNDEYGWDVVIAVYLTYGMGIGALLWITLIVWAKVLERLIYRYKFDRALIEFVRHKRQEKNSKNL